MNGGFLRCCFAIIMLLVLLSLLVSLVLQPALDALHKFNRCASLHTPRRPRQSKINATAPPGPAG